MALNALITFLIPAYCRENGALRSALSIVEQCTSDTRGLIKVWINDDCSPNFSFDFYDSILSQYYVNCDIRVSRNSANLGMSRNIFMMVSEVTSSYWTVLTDDDFLLPGSLIPMLDVLQAAQSLDLSSIITLRRCYDEAGHFLFNDAVYGTDYPSIIYPGPLSSIKYLFNAHVLTGLFIKSGLDLCFWQQNIDNAYFPMLHFSSTLLNGYALSIAQPWFRHTVNNETHWHQWGDTDLDISRRINSDILVVFWVVMRQAFCLPMSPSLRLLILYYFYIHSTSTLAAFLRASGFVYVVKLILSLKTNYGLYRAHLLCCLLLALVGLALSYLKTSLKSVLRTLMQPKTLNY
jgi:hypothetical protein